MVSDYRSYAKKAFSVLLATLLIFSFSAFAFGEFTDDGGLTCAQQHVVPDFSSKNASYAWRISREFTHLCGTLR